MLPKVKRKKGKVLEFPYYFQCIDQYDRITSIYNNINDKKKKFTF